MFRRIIAWLQAFADANAARLETDRYRALYEAERKQRLAAERDAIDRLSTIRELRDELHELKRERTERELFWSLNGPKLRAVKGSGGHRA